MSLFDLGVSSVIMISTLAVKVSTVYRSIITILTLAGKVSTACRGMAAILRAVLKVYEVFKHAPGDYRNISEEVKLLEVIVDGAVQYFKGTILSDQKKSEGREVLQGCQNILKDLHVFIENQKALASANMRQGRQFLKRFKLGNERITTLRARLISNSILLSNFIRSCEHLQMQEQLTKLLDLHHENSMVIPKFTTAIAESGDSEHGFEELCRDLHQPRVTPDMINTATLGLPKYHQNPAGNVLDSNIESQGQSQVPNGRTANAGIVFPTLVDNTPAGNDTTEPSLAPNLANTTITRVISMFDWAHPQINILIRQLIPVAATVWNTKPMPRLKYTGHINFAGDSSETTLRKARCKGHDDVKNSVSIYANASKHTPLHLTTSNGHADIARLLREKGNPLDAMGGFQSTPLHVAAREGHTEVVDLLCKNGAPIDAVDAFNCTPLHMAAMEGHTDVIELLLQNGASIDSIDRFKYTPLHYAAIRGHPRTVKLLLENGAKMVHEKAALHIETRPGPGIWKQLLQHSEDRYIPYQKD